MNTAYFGSIILCIFAVISFIFITAFAYTIQMPVLASLGLLVALVCYVVSYVINKKNFWKSFIIGIIIGFPIGLVTGYSYQASYTGSFFSHNHQILSIASARCEGDQIMVLLHNPSPQTIYMDDVQIDYLEGSCQNMEAESQEFAPNSDAHYILFRQCTPGSITIRITSPEGHDQTTLNCISE